MDLEARNKAIYSFLYRIIVQTSVDKRLEEYAY